MSSLLRTRELERFKTLPNHPNPNVMKFKPQRTSIAKKKAMELKQTNSKYLQNSNEVPLFSAKSRGVVGVPTGLYNNTKLLVLKVICYFYFYLYFLICKVCLSDHIIHL